MTRISLLSTLMISSALVSPGAWAQTQNAETPAEPSVDISGPGIRADDEVIVVQGRYIPEPIRATSEVISVLSSEEIARTGEGDIAGALQRITGLSLVGGRFVYVRGLGERYSLALLNGLPLPSPEPLRRVVPLDIFPTSVIASSVVQKSYSANYPGEFGGGVINLTTTAIPEESYLTVGGSISGDSETTFERGYTYFGSRSDWTGFDNGARDIPGGLKAAMNSSLPILRGQNFTEDQIKGFAASLANASTSLIQSNDNIPMNGAIDFSGGLALDIGSDRLGITAAFGWDNSWQTRGGLQQETGGIASDTEGNPTIYPDNDFRFLSTENRIVVHGLFGVGYEFGEHKLRWTNLYIRDTLKEARIQDGTDELGASGARLNKSYTSWFERQLIDTQFVGEFKFGDWSLDVRGTYANTQREAPYEREFIYRFEGGAVNDFVNRLNGSGQRADITFSDLNEDVWAGSASVVYNLPTARDISISAGYAYNDTQRTSTRRKFRFQPTSGSLPLDVAQERPDYLLSDYNIYTYGIILNDLSTAGGAARYDAGLEVHAGYAQIEAELVEFLRATAGVRYETATQSVTVFRLAAAGESPWPLDSNQAPALKNDYFLPAATLTWNFAEDMQLRLAASKTIARPQFRELAPQQYTDPENDRKFSGNPRLQDSELLNLEARYEWYMGRNERLSLAGFYKKIDNPIESVAVLDPNGVTVNFANAPEAELYGAEAEVQKYFALTDWLPGTFFETRDLLVAVNYTWTQSRLNVSDGDMILFPGFENPVPASTAFADGTKMTGQSDHIVNVQLGFEDSESLSQQTLMLTYASNRITNRFTSGQTPLDFIEKPGIRLDFVVRQGLTVAGKDLELKLEARNLTGQGYEEFQQHNGARVYLNKYDIGRSFSLGLSAKF